MKKSNSVYAKKEKVIKNTSNNFSKQELSLAETPLFFPQGYEKIFLAIYFISLPYIVGLMFQFFYIADSKVELFLSLNEQGSFILTWAIGYEIIAALMLLYILKMAISFSRENMMKSKGTYNRNFRRP